MIFAIWLSLFSWTKIEFNKEKRHLIGDHVFAVFAKEINIAAMATFHNKFFIRDTITFWLYATNFARFIKFWSSEQDHERICDGFIYSRRLTETERKTPDTTRVLILPLTVLTELFSWKSRGLSQKITKITNKKTPPKSRKSQAKDLKISEKSRTFFENVLVWRFEWEFLIFFWQKL